MTVLAFPTPSFIARLGRYPGPGVVAVSGGADSTALALLMPDALRSRSWLVSFHHHLRSEADDEIEAVVALAKSAGYAGVEVVHLDGQGIRAQGNLQGGARSERRRYLWEFMLHKKLSWIYTGHQRDDWFETVYSQTLRQRGPQNCRGIAEYQGPWVRPLLKIGSQEIRGWLTEIKVRWCHDSSNDQLYYQRNQIRHLFIPDLIHRGPGLHWLRSVGQRASNLYADAHRWLMCRSCGSPTSALALRTDQAINPEVQKAALCLWAARKGAEISADHWHQLDKGARKISIRGAILERLDEWIWILSRPEIKVLEERDSIEQSGDPRFRKLLLDKPASVLNIIRIERGYPAGGHFPGNEKTAARRKYRVAAIPGCVRPYLFWSYDPTVNPAIEFEFNTSAGNNSIHLLR